MNNKKLIVWIGLLGLSLPAIAGQNFVPYLGVDAKWDNMEFKKTAGGNVISKNYPETNLFGGVKFNECLALEIGYESTTQKKKSVAVAPGDPFFGFSDFTFSPLNSKTKTKISGFHINVVGLYPIFEAYCLDLFGSIGVARLRLKSHLDFAVPSNPSVIESRDFSKQKMVPRVTLGLQQMLNNNMGLRAMLTWEKTSSFKNIYARNARIYMRPKDSKGIGVGIFYRF